MLCAGIRAAERLHPRDYEHDPFNLYGDGDAQVGKYAQMHWKQ